MSARETQRRVDGGPLTLAPDVFIAPSVRLEGAVSLGPRANVWFGSVVDGREAPVELAAGANVQDNCVVRGTRGHPARLGPYAAMGHNAQVIGATVDERSLIAIGATVRPGAHVGMRCIVAANATVPEGMRVPPGSLVIGQGRIVRALTEAEVERIVHTAAEYLRLAAEYRERLGRGGPGDRSPGETGGG